MTLTLELKDELAQRLESEAQRRHMSKEQLATVGIEQVVGGCPEDSKVMIAEIIAERRELYKRLA